MNDRYRKRLIGQIEILECLADPDRDTILLLHGFGAEACDLLALSEVNREANWIFPEGPLLIPISRNRTGRAWFEVNVPLLIQAVQAQRFDSIATAFPPDLNEARHLIDTLIADLKIPRSKLILGGFSQGAVLAVETALKGNEPIKGLLIFSGTLINASQWKQLAPHHAHTLFFQSHGSNDPLLPFQKAEELAQLLMSSGLKGELHAFHGGHEIPRSILNHLSSFLRSHKI